MHINELLIRIYNNNNIKSKCYMVKNVFTLVNLYLKHGNGSRYITKSILLK